jgi:hypothetical protein
LLLQKSTKKGDPAVIASRSLKKLKNQKKNPAISGMMQALFKFFTLFQIHSSAASTAGFASCKTYLLSEQNTKSEVSQHINTVYLEIKSSGDLLFFMET